MADDAFERESLILYVDVLLHELVIRQVFLDGLGVLLDPILQLLILEDEVIDELLSLFIDLLLLQLQDLFLHLVILG